MLDVLSVVTVVGIVAGLVLVTVGGLRRNEYDRDNP